MVKDTIDLPSFSSRGSLIFLQDKTRDSTDKEVQRDRERKKEHLQEHKREEEWKEVKGRDWNIGKVGGGTERKQ